MGGGGDSYFDVKCMTQHCSVLFDTKSLYNVEKFMSIQDLTLLIPTTR